jgi:3-phytase
LTDIPTDLNDVYGLCLYQYDGQLEVIINDTDGQFNRYQLAIDSSDISDISAKKIDYFRANSQPEGCVVDDDTKRLFFGEESTGVWKMQLDNINEQPVLIAKAHSPVKADIEGMGIYSIDGEKFLVVSSQGNNRFAIYRIDADNELLGVFAISANKALGIDGVSETDGIEVTSVALGDRFPKGILVVQDARNVMPMAPQNFKLVSGEYLYDFITLKIRQLAQKSKLDLATIMHSKYTQRICKTRDLTTPQVQTRFLVLGLPTHQPDAFCSASGGGARLPHLRAILNVYQKRRSQYHWHRLLVWHLLMKYVWA